MGDLRPDPINLKAALAETYGITAEHVEPVDGGANLDARAYRIKSADGLVRFLKVRNAAPPSAATAIPHFLGSAGISQVLAPLPTLTGAFAARAAGLHLVLYPFIDGHNAMDVSLTAGQWQTLGATVRRIHDTSLPPALRSFAPTESFTGEYRAEVSEYVRGAAFGAYDAGAGRGLAQLLRSRRHEIEHMLARARRLAAALAGTPRPAFVLCHADMHRWNLQVDPEGKVWIVDWDSLRLAPRECDLMFIGGNIGGLAGEGVEEAFYQGYGEAPVDRAALAYYRYERIITDIALFCREIWSKTARSPDDCSRITRMVASNFLPGNELEAAYRVDPAASPHHPGGTWGARGAETAG